MTISDEPLCPLSRSVPIKVILCRLEKNVENFNKQQAVFLEQKSGLICRQAKNQGDNLES